jgi:hypothetical protein
MRAFVLTALGALAMAGSAGSEPSAPSSPTSAAPAVAVVTGATVEGEAPLRGVKEADPLVCKSETPIGSKLPVKTCLRKSERDRQKRDSQEALQLIQRRSDGPVKTDGPFQ